MEIPSLPQRPGDRPQTTPTNPHTQLTQQPPDDDLREELCRRLFALPGVVERPSVISVPGARALWLEEGVGPAPADAFMAGREFAHFHPRSDHSLHAMLPVDVARAAVDAGWAEQHPVARLGLIGEGAVMLYAPRDDDELDVIEQLVAISHGYARGEV
ncbi:MAG: hypothetical protein QOJ13_3330 [Gaiellales bacterium]|jgi:hypothetical protein|nr:hypothetical protein [Gaiellales bacterium]MDX6594134.1 hypothetical protein [Gaiellales bacterium]